MKAAAFGLVRAESVEEVLGALAEHGDEARVVAGGQSLAPMMALRLASPEVLVDLAGVAGLDGLTMDDAGLRLGAMVRQRTVERAPGVPGVAPLVAEAVPHIGHTAIRSQGTVCGSLAHADPAAELPAVALAAGATMHLRSGRGPRTVAAADFFTGYYSTAIEPTEILEAVSFPTLPARSGTAFVEFSRRHGDFALVGVAATVTLAADGAIIAASVALSGVASTPWPAAAAAALLVGARPDRPRGAASPATGSTESASPTTIAAPSRPEREAAPSGPAPGRDPAGPWVVGGAAPRPEHGQPVGSSWAASGRGAAASELASSSGLRPELGPYGAAVRAAAAAVRAEVDPGADLHATAAYRRHLAAVLTERALTTALARAVAAADPDRTDAVRRDGAARSIEEEGS